YKPAHDKPFGHAGNRALASRPQIRMDILRRAAHHRRRVFRCLCAFPGQPAVLDAVGVFLAYLPGHGSFAQLVRTRTWPDAASTASAAMAASLIPAWCIGDLRGAADPCRLLCAAHVLRTSRTAFHIASCGRVSDRPGYTRRSDLGGHAAIPEACL